MIKLTIGFLLTVSVVFAADPCRFEHSELGVIDLTTLGRTDGIAAFADRPTDTPILFSMLISFSSMYLFSNTFLC